MTARCIALFVAWLLALTPASRAADSGRLPNFVIIYADDLGYGDLGCFGGHSQGTPNLDRMAADGIKLTDFYTAQSACSASRMALLTGCYPNRLGILGALNPNARTGISDNEATIAQVLKGRGYATAIYGKWHLGHHAPFLPTRHGFDDYFGLPYSNDMWPNHPTKKDFPELPLIEGERVIANNPDQNELTTWYTERAVKFIEGHKDRPFFLYVPHAMMHVPLHVSERFRRKSGRGLYADVLLELDWSVGEILAALKRSGIDDQTLVVFTSDNGPWLPYGNHGGSAGHLREGKGTTFEGGQREPFIARWPGRIPAGTVCREPVMTIDLLPTLAKLAGTAPASGRKIDGLDIWPLLSSQGGAHSPHDALYYYGGRELHAVRSGRWKLHFPHAYPSLVDKPGSDGKPGKTQLRKIGFSLFDLEADPGETTDIAPLHPDVVARLQELAEVARDDLGDSLTGREGKGLRPPGKF